VWRLMGQNFLSAHGSMGRVIENVLAKGKQTHRTKPAAVQLPHKNRKTYRTQSKVMKGFRKGRQKLDGKSANDLRALAFHLVADYYGIRILLLSNISVDVMIMNE
jgi:hypothetical protein